MSSQPASNRRSRHQSRRRSQSSTQLHRFRPTLEILEDRTLLDGTGPRILSLSPTEVRNATFDYIDVQFNEAIDVDTFTTDDVSIAGPEGSVTATGISQLSPDTFRVMFSALTVRGTYQATIGPDIADLAGNPMDQNQNGANGEAVADRYAGSLVYIDADVIFTNSITLGESDTTYDGLDILVEGTTVTINGPHGFNSVHVIDGGVLTHTANSDSETHKLELEVTEQVIVDSTSRIDVTGKGYLEGRTTGNTTTGGATGQSGGSHGGLGGSRNGASDTVYGDYADPEDWGAGGASGGATGGGLVLITAGALDLDGIVAADGLPGRFSSSGSGAGGGIRIDVDSLRGTGSIHADGANSRFGQFNGGAGGGGRVAVYARDFGTFDTNRINAFGGIGAVQGGAGTVYLRDTDDPTGTLILDGGSDNNHGAGLTPLGLPGDTVLAIPDVVIIRGQNTHVRQEHAGLALDFQSTLTIEEQGQLFIVDNLHLKAGSSTTVTTSGELRVDDTLTLDGPLVLDNHGRVQVGGELVSSQALTIDDATITAGRIEAPSVSVINGGLLTSLTSTTTRMHKLEIEVDGTLSVDSSSRIDVSGKGYRVGRTTGNTTTGAATGRSGGSHGGLGGSRDGASNAVYGDYADPEDWGAAGGVGNPAGAPTGGAGGGLVLITAGALNLDGVVAADGVAGRGTSSGAGAGGSIRVDVDSLRGDGSIHADGGNSGTDRFGGGAGGGGRIAVYAGDFGTFDTDRIHASGGIGWANGGPGTVHIVQGSRHTHVRSYSPAGINDGQVNESFDHVTLHFNKEIDVSAFSPSLITVDGPLGPINPISFVAVGDRTYRLDLGEQTENGRYHFTLSPDIRDVEGFQLDQDADGIPGELEDGYSFTLILDTVAPRVTSHTPAGDVAGTLSSIDVWLSEKIDRSTFTTSDMTLVGPGGQNVAVTSLKEVGLNRYRIGFAPQTTVGTYQLSLGPDVSDLAGNQLDQDGDGVFGESVDDVFSTTINLTSLDLQITTINLNPQQLVAGEPVDVSWTGFNASGALLLGDWSDRVYLSLDTTWDINDIPLATVEHVGGLAENETYPASATINVPGVLPRDYYVLVRTDVFNEQKEEVANEGNNVLASGPHSLRVNALPGDGTAITGSLSSVDPTDYYEITLAAGETLRVRLDSPNSSRTELYASYAAVPTRLSYDERIATPETTKEITLTGIAGGGTYYVFVYADQPSTNVAYTITAETAPLFVSSISPTRHGTSVPPIITVTGEGFDENTTVNLVLGEETHSIPVQFVSPSTLILSDVPRLTPGIYTVQVTRAGRTAELVDAFTVVAEGQHNLETNLIVPGNVSPGFAVKQTLWVEYRNTGDVAMAAPLLQVTASSLGLITADEEQANALRGTRRPIPNGLGNSVQVIGLGSGATPGILQPGDSGRIPVYYVGLEEDRGQGGVTFSLGTLSTFDTTEKVAYLTNPNERVVFERPGHGRRNISPGSPVEPFRLRRADGNTGPTQKLNGGSLGGAGSINLGPPNVFEEFLPTDWQAIIDSRPDSIPEDAWKSILFNVREETGFLWADYVQEMTENANYLATVGQTSHRVSDLWGFEVAEASAALNPVRFLAGAVDATIPAPGLPLTFSRVYGNSIPSRFRSSTLGQGWTHNWDIFADVQDNGDVVLHGPGGVDRFFTRNGNGTFTAAPGDFGLLTFSGGAYRLVETDGTIWQFRTDDLLGFVEDTNGNRITLDYTNGKVTSIAHSSGRALLLEYAREDFGFPLTLRSITDTQGPGTEDDRLTRYEYAYDGAKALLRKVTAPGNRITEYAYQPRDTVSLMSFDTQAG